MSIKLGELRNLIEPANTVLLLGAGASVPSGAPTGSELATRLWEKAAKVSAQSDDLTETASILVRRLSRRPVVDVIRAALSPLKPAGGLLGLPKLGWHQLFTTNFDQLLEKAFAQNSIPLTAIRSNYDFTNKENNTEQRLYKIHGCITQDAAFGDKASMILTEDDYEQHEKYRQSMFALLQAALLTKDALIIGQSLKDRHLHDLVRRVLNAKQEGSTGQVFVLVYDQDDLRAPLLEDRGARIVFGGIDQFVHSFAEVVQDKLAIEKIQTEALLPLRLVSAVEEVSSKALAPANIVRMFNGGPAGYADIRANVTFQRSQETEILRRIVDDRLPAVAITGAAGVGKTTFARQLLMKLHEKGIYAWEHRPDFSFQYQNWIGVEANLRESGKRGVLFLDECTHFMRATNALLDHISDIDNSALSIVVTANSAQWAPRLKSPNFSVRGSVIELSTLQDSEIHSLLNLVEHNKKIEELVDPSFRKERREKKFNALRQKCSADMFVCLKNIFANESLDTILLQEYDALASILQDYYRFVAAIEAIGTKAHRQLIIRMLKINPGQIGAILDGLTGIVDEYDIRASAGIFGWSTRHLVIARKITDYKFSSLDDLCHLFETVIDNLNPAEPVELQSIRALCDTEYGIGRIGDSTLRKKLYRNLISIAPGERIPWHRLIREYIIDSDPDQAEISIRNAEASVGSDGPIARFKVRLLVLRARTTKGISGSDRLAMLRRAYEQAMRNIDAHKMDKHSYRVLCDVAVEMMRHGESRYILEEAVDHMRQAATKILDPEMDDTLHQYYKMLARAH
ncbi:MAG: SIR2 family protein [Nitrobacter sp.]